MHLLRCVSDLSASFDQLDIPRGIGEKVLLHACLLVFAGHCGD